MKNRTKHLLLFAALFLMCDKPEQADLFKPTEDDGSYLVLQESDLAAGPHHTRHLEMFGKYINGINRAVLQGIDIVQAHAIDGGGYFIGIHTDPPESPVYYDLKLFGDPLIKAPRQSSYCSGATYSAFIEALNLLMPQGRQKLTPERFEALRMQEPDGGRREDFVKFWGNWNADGFGCHFALVQYARMGQVLRPEQLRPGDFINISWVSGLGHSVIFLGWYEAQSDRKIVYWSSQRATNGYGDQLVSLSKIKEIKAVRLSNPENLLSYKTDETISTDIPGDVIDW